MAYIKRELRKGTKAYYVTRYGRTLGVVERVYIPGNSRAVYAEMRVTACRRGAYRTGEIINASVASIMPRECYKTRRGSFGTRWYAFPYTPIVTED